MMKYKNYLPLILIVIGAGFSLKIYHSIPAAKTIDIQIELFKFFAFSVFIGGLLLMYNFALEKHSSRKALRHQVIHFRNDLITAFSNIQAARRRLRPLCSVSEDSIDVKVFEPFNSAIMLLSIAQLDIEQLRRELELNINFLGIWGTGVETDLKIVDNFVRACLKEYEVNSDLEEGALTVSNSHKLSEFIFDSEPPEYVEAFNRINRRILTHIAPKK